MSKSVKVVRTTKDGDERLKNVSEVEYATLATGEQIITVQADKKCQEIIGFGGAFTEAAAYTLSRISREHRKEIIDAYYHPERGIGYNIGRVHIHSCDFALGNYTYVEDNDTELKTFSIEHDHELIIPLVKEAMDLCPEEMKILASPWSPPAWMKTNGEMNNGGQLKPEYFQTWADYYVKFIEAYEAVDIPIFALTVQNEPAAVQTWDSCIYSAEEERDFVKDYLGPTLEKAGMLDSKKLLVWDHNRDIMVERASTVLNDPEASKYVWGTGFHWYVSEDFAQVGKVHDLFPDKHLLFTEGCIEGGVRLGDWTSGERYARNMMGDLNNWCEGYLDWNIVLDEIGGPNHVGNYCDAPIIADTVNDVVHYNSSYYYIGHFSKFVKRGAKRLVSQFDAEDLNFVAFENPDGDMIYILMNTSEDNQSVSISVKGQYLNLDIVGRSIMTMVG